MRNLRVTVIYVKTNVKQNFYIYISVPLIKNYKQKQPSRDVLEKKCSENMQQVYRRAPMPQCDCNKAAEHLDGYFCIRNVKHRIHSATVYAKHLFTLSKIISKAKNLILFLCYLCRCFFLVPINLYILLDILQLLFFYLPGLSKNNVCLRFLSNQSNTKYYQ